jgi:hypothetical protein
VAKLWQSCGTGVSPVVFTISTQGRAAGFSLRGASNVNGTNQLTDSPHEISTFRRLKCR